MDYTAYMTDPRDTATYSPDEDQFNEGQGDAYEGRPMQASNQYYVNGYRKAMLELDGQVQQQHQNDTNPDWF